MGNLSVDSLTIAERTALQECDFSREVLAVTTTGNGAKTIVKLSREEVTCWQLFLKFFGAGKLARTNVHLREVATHLDKYNWKEVAETDVAYLKVCEIANKALRSKGMGQLYEKVSKESCNASVTLNMHGRKEQLVKLQIYWNPMLKAKDLTALLANKIPAFVSTHALDQNNYLLHKEVLVSKDLFKQLKFNVHYHGQYIAGYWPGFSDV